MPQYLRLGDIDLSKNISGEIKTDGGFFTVIQDNPISLRSKPRKGVPKGTRISFSVIFDDADEAEAFQLYCSTTDAVDIPLYLRTPDQYYRIVRIVLRAGETSTSPGGFLQYTYDVVCYLESPYGQAAEALFQSHGFQAISVSSAEAVAVIDENGNVRKFEAGVWAVLDTEFGAIDISISNSGEVAAVSATDGRLYIWSGSAWALHSPSTQQFKRISHTNSATFTFFAIGIDDVVYEWYGSSWINKTQTAKDISAARYDLAEAVGLDGKIYLTTDLGASWTEIAGSPSNASTVAFPGPDTCVITDDEGKMKYWEYPSTWKEFGQAGNFYIDVDGAILSVIWAITENRASRAYHYIMTGWLWIWESPVYIPITEPIDNTEGHISGFLDATINCDPAVHVLALSLLIGSSDSLVLCDEALSGEVWELFEEYRLLETYEDTFESGDKWALDTTGDGTFDTDHIDLADSEMAYYTLSGPHPSQKPVKMTAELSGEGYVEVSEDGQEWRQVISPAQIQSGRAVYSLSRTEFMSDISVRFSGPLQIDYVKFEVEREIQDDVPSVPAGETVSFCISAYESGSQINGSFTPRRKL